MDKNYTILLRSAGFTPKVRGPWAICGEVQCEQGWKLHVSAVPTNVGKLLSSVLPLLRERGTAYKIARDEPTLRLLNEGALGWTQIGKFMTIYPRTHEESRRLAEKLVEITSDCEGPVIPTDLRLGVVIYTRYGSFNPPIIRDRLGQIFTALRNHDGSLRTDNYSIPFESPVNVDNPFANWPPFLVPENPTRTPGRLFGPGYFILEPLNIHPKGSVFLALDMRAQETVALKVLKEGRQHCMSDAYGRDIRTRLRHQEQLHRSLNGLVPIPACEAYFEVTGNGYLPLEYIDGYDIGDRPSLPFSSLDNEAQQLLLRDILSFTDSLQLLHATGYVHRDLAPSNIRVKSNGSVMLLDLELAHPVDSSSPPFSQGTPGFTSPQQEASEKPCFADDVFSVGALLVLLLAGLDPRRVLHVKQSQRYWQLCELSGAPNAVVTMVTSCLDYSPAERPTLPDIRTVIHSILDAPKEFLKNPVCVPSLSLAYQPHHSLEHTNQLLESAAKGLLHDVMLDGDTGFWLSPEIRPRLDRNGDVPYSYSLYRSANRGIAGVVYVLSRLASHGIAPKTLDTRIEQAVDWLLQHQPTPDDQLPGLHFGEAGVALAIAETVRAGLLSAHSWLEDYLSEALAGPLDWPDLTHGAAGQGIAAMECSDVLGDDQWKQFSHRCAKYLIDTQLEDGAWKMPVGVDGMSDRIYSGFAHGVAGIAYFLAEYAARFDCEKAACACRAATQWLIYNSHTTSKGSLEWAISSDDETVWKWWCHGAPGIALAFLRLFEYTGCEQYAEIAIKALNTHPFDIRYSNLSQCHGLSGLGEIYLEAYRVLQDQKWRRYAERIGEILIHLSRQSEKGGLTWLVEDPYNPTADLMVGSAGVVHFLFRLYVEDPLIGLPLLTRKASHWSIQNVAK